MNTIADPPQQGLQSPDRLARLLHHHARLGPRRKEAPAHRWAVQNPHVQPRDGRRDAAGSLAQRHRSLQGAAHGLLAVLRVPPGQRRQRRDVAQRPGHFRADSQVWREQPQCCAVDEERQQAKDHRNLLWMGELRWRHQHFLV